MYGTLLDQRVFESLVEKTMPILWDHLVKSDVQLSVVSLPWFLSLYINSMPLVFAFRVLDVFFLEGPKVLFQVGLAILRINGEDLLDATDDGAFISVLKSYFSRLDESAHPKSENEKLRAVTRFQELMVVAFKEFAGITQSTISDQRAKHKDTVLINIESFAKRTSIRNLGPDSKRLSPEDLGALYDRFYGVLYERQQRSQLRQEDADRRAKAAKYKSASGQLAGAVMADSTVEKGRVGLGPSPTQMDYDGFREFLAGTTRWAITDSPSSPLREWASDGHSYFGGSVRQRNGPVAPWGEGKPQPADHEFMRRLFNRWETEKGSGLSLQNVVTGLAQVKGTPDIMSSISYFFELHDDDGDGKVDREGILRISEALLFLSRRGLDGSLTPSHSTTGLNESDPATNGGLEPGKSGNMDEKFLNSVSAFIRRCFEYADPDHPSNRDSQAVGQKGNSNAAALESFSIGDDDDEDNLVDRDGGAQPSQPGAKSPSASTPPSKATNKPRPGTLRQASQAKAQSANLALDPANPLHITLPTFRMVILADELLEQFFESSFPASFRLSDRPLPSGGTSSSSHLTTFSSLAGQRIGAGSALPIGGTIGSVPPGKGLRGVLDNIVSDGMRVAAEVRRRVDDAQREMEKNALGRDEDDEDDEGPGIAGAESGEADRRSVREADRDLLEGAEAEVGSIKDRDVEDDLLGPAISAGSGPRGRSASSTTEGIVEFDRT